MTWETVERRAVRKIVQPGVTVSAGIVGRTPHQQIIVCVRHPPEWFTGRVLVTLQVGSGDHAGMLRIVPGGTPLRAITTIDMRNSGRNRRIASTQIRVGAWDAVQPGAHRATECRFNFSDDEIVIWLPEWAGGTGQQTVEKVHVPQTSHSPALKPVEASTPLLRTPQPKSSQPPVTRAESITRVSASLSGPQVADFDTVAAWAAQRGVQFREWDDLPKVNRKREDLLLMPFARKLPGRSVHGGARP